MPSETEGILRQKIAICSGVPGGVQADTIQTQNACFVAQCDTGRRPREP